MKKHKETIKIQKELASELQRLLNAEELDLHKEKIGKDSTIETFTARFSDGVEADIKVCAGLTNCFIDPVLFDENGSDIGVLDCETELLGKYEFKHDENIYEVTIEVN